MIRFSAGESEIAGLLHFLARRMPGGLRLVPMSGRTRADLRLRHTPRPLLRQLESVDQALEWGLRPATGDDAAPILSRRTDSSNDPLIVDADASRLIVLQLGPAQGQERRRDGLLEARDWVERDASGKTLLPESSVARDLVERCARRVRRRGQYQQGRWHLPE